MVGERNEDGFAGLTLESEALGGIEAIFVPEAGMVCCSLRHRGEELLGQRGGLRRYVEVGSTMGIPLLHPWANRLGRGEFEVAGRAVDLDLPALRGKRDGAGLPMHGLLTAARGWQGDRHWEIDGGGALAASFDFGAYPRLTPAFPFPHRRRRRPPRLLRLPSVSPPARSGARRLAPRGTRARTPGARPWPASDRPPRVGRDRAGPAWLTALRRCLSGTARRRAVRALGRRATGGAEHGARLPVRPDLHACRERRGRDRADDGADQCSRGRRSGPASGRARQVLLRDFLAHRLLMGTAGFEPATSRV